MEIFNANGFVPEGVLDTNGDCYIGILTKTKYKKEDYQINSERNALIIKNNDEYTGCIVPVIWAYNDNKTKVYKCKILNKYYKLEEIKFVD